MFQKFQHIVSIVHIPRTNQICLLEYRKLAAQTLSVVNDNYTIAAAVENARSSVTRRFGGESHRSLFLLFLNSVLSVFITWAHKQSPCLYILMTYISFASASSLISTLYYLLKLARSIAFFSTPPSNLRIHIWIEPYVLPLNNLFH